MRGDLRIEIDSCFGPFLAANGFQETFYDYDAEMFGNEILDLSSSDLGIRFVRDRGQIWIELKFMGEAYTPIQLLLQQLGIAQPDPPKGDWIPQRGYLFGADHLIVEWPRLVRLLLRSKAN